MTEGTAVEVGISVYTNPEGHPEDPSYVVGDLVFEREEAVKLAERLAYLVTLTAPA